MKLINLKQYRASKVKLETNEFLARVKSLEYQENVVCVIAERSRPECGVGEVRALVAASSENGRKLKVGDEIQLRNYRREPTPHCLAYAVLVRILGAK